MPPKGNASKRILAAKVHTIFELVRDTVFGMKTVNVTIRFFETLWQEVKQRAKDTGHSNNNMVNLLVRESLEELKKPPFSPYKLLVNNTLVVLYDRIKDEIAAVHISEDLEYNLDFLCDVHVGQPSCEHVAFVKKIPLVKQWIVDNKREQKY